MELYTPLKNLSLQRFQKANPKCNINEPIYRDIVSKRSEVSHLLFHKNIITIYSDWP